MQKQKVETGKDIMFLFCVYVYMLYKKKIYWIVVLSHVNANADSMEFESFFLSQKECPCSTDSGDHKGWWYLPEIIGKLNPIEKDILGGQIP